MQSNELLSHWQQLCGTDLGTTEWLTVDQARIDSFADTTLDHQVIHIDPDADATKKLGGTIAHGFLSLSLLSYLSSTLTSPHVAGHSILNYGLNRVRFLMPVPSGSDIRLHMKVVQAQEKSQGVLVTYNSELEIRDQDKPAFIAEHLALLLFH